MTPRELQWRLNGQQELENREFERLAQLACWLLNAQRGKKQKAIQVKDLLKPKQRQPKQKRWKPT